jgi:hypothetical protein
VTAGSVWSYRDDGSDQGTVWRTRNFDESAWARGPAQLGYGGDGEVTTVDFGGDPNAKYITTYFRRTFTVTQPAYVQALALSVLRDDGVAVYLNGIEVMRDNLPVGVITYTTLALTTISGISETTFMTTSISPSFLVTGVNVLAVEVHQVLSTSTDLGFDLSLMSTSTYLPRNDPALLAAGDIAACYSVGDEATANLLDTLAGTLITLGDNAYDNGTAAEFANCYQPTWGRHRARTFPVPGNHDYNTLNATAYYTYFGAVAGDPTKGYYSFDVGAWHLIALNSNCATIGGCGIGSPQYAWLVADLAAHTNPCTLAYWHHPRFSSGAHGDDATYAPFWQALYAADVDLILNGHDHNYERFAPQNPAAIADSTRGIREFVVGTGGNTLRDFPIIRANSEVRDYVTWGVLKLNLHATSYDWQFVPVSGNAFTDSGSGACH